MDKVLIEKLFAGLLEEATPIGCTYVNEWGLTTIPFLCESQRFLALYQPVSSDPVTQRLVYEFSHRETGHVVSGNAYLMKFASADQYLAGKDFAPLSALPAVRMAVRFRIPAVLASVTNVFFQDVPSAEELYFMPGDTPEESMRAHKLNLWYSRVADRIGVTQLGLQKIHPNVGEGWYGYRKTSVKGHAAPQGRVNQTADGVAEPVISPGQPAKDIRT